MQVIAVINQKGGVGKSTISVNLSHGLVLNGKRVLLVDTDPQAHSSTIFFPRTPSTLNLEGQEQDATIENLLRDKKCDINSVIQHARLNGDIVANLGIIPSNIHLAAVAEEIAAQWFREKLLHDHIQRVQREFDFVILDCPPNLGVLTINAMFAANRILIPTTYSRYSLDGMADLMESLGHIKQGHGYTFQVVRNGFDARNRQSNLFVEENLAPISDHLMATVIRRTEAINQAQMAEQTIFSFAPGTNGAEDFSALSEEVLNG